MFGAKREDINGKWTKLQNAWVNAFYGILRLTYLGILNRDN